MAITPRLLFLLPPLVLIAADPAPKEDKKEAILRRFADEFVLLTPGKGKFPASFAMGSAGDAPASEKPEHVVTLRQPFALAKYEVTQELYQAIAGKNPSRWKGPRNSIEMVDWKEANTFCEQVTTELRKLKLLKDDEVIRLPTEAEWEYACRADTKTRYSFGDKEADLGDHAWYKGNSKGEDPPVGKKKPNAWGLYDMHGYIWEWCQDSWHPSYEGAPKDASAWQEREAKERVVRGGSWADQADQARSAYRHHVAATTRSDTIGFRCVKAAIGGKK